MTKLSDTECTLLGLALFSVQRVEFALYGMAAHASHLPSAQNDRRFKNLTPEKFLRGDIRELKATFGQIATAFGESFLIATEDLERFCADRNLIVHNYFRTFHVDVRGRGQRTDGAEFLTDFIQRATQWESIIRGLIIELKVAAAQKEGRENEVSLTGREAQDVEAFRQHVHRFLTEQIRASTRTK